MSMSDDVSTKDVSNLSGRTRGERNLSNFRRNQFPISPRVGETVMGSLIANSAIWPTYQLHRMVTKAVCVVSTEEKASLQI